MDSSGLKTGMVLGWDMLMKDSRTYIEMNKVSASGITRYRWPQQGGKLAIELKGADNRREKFMLDISEGKRTTSISVGLIPERKSKMQMRASESPIIRIDYASEPSMVVHTNPDGGVVTGTHIHIDVDDPYRMSWAFPIDCQTILDSSVDIRNVADIFFAFMDACHIDKSICVEPLLEV